MGIRLIVWGWLTLLLLATGGTAVSAEAAPFVGFSLQEGSGLTAAPEGADETFSWVGELRSFAFHLLKDVRRWSIRLSHLVQRSAQFWFGWLTGSIGLLMFGGLVSAIDRRILLIAWQRGARVAIGYAWIGVVVFLRLLRDSSVPGRLRLIIPCALIYGIISNQWLDTGLPLLDATDELLIMGFASRWFVRRCPEAVLSRHASYAQARAEALIPTSSEQGS